MAGRLAAVTLAVADVPRAAAFYAGLLGDPPPVGFLRDAVWPGARLTFGVPDVDAAVAAVRAHGCEASPAGGRADCRDPAGLAFELAPPTPVPPAIAAVLLYVPDREAARSFYAAVLGARDALVAVTAGRGRPGVIPTYRVADLARAAAVVRALGGTATDPAADGRPLCTDDQGLSFYLRG